MKKIENMTPAKTLITAEQLLCEAKEHKLKLTLPQSSKKTSYPDEIVDCQFHKRKFFQNDIYKDRLSLSNLIEYTIKWKDNDQPLDLSISSLKHSFERSQLISQQEQSKNKQNPLLSSSQSSLSSSQKTDLIAIPKEKAVCAVCSKTFIGRSQLSLHLGIHKPKRSFHCEICNISFYSKGHLMKHSKATSHLNKLHMNNIGKTTYLNPRPFECMDCEVAFRIRGHLTKHLRSKMHIIKLECLGKLPFGLYTEMERLEISLSTDSPIDTTDCKRSLESLRKLSQQLFDPDKMKDFYSKISDFENNQEDDETFTDDEIVVENGENLEEENKLISNDDISDDSTCLKKKNKLPQFEMKSPTSLKTLPDSSFNNTMRSSTCNMCLETFKSPKYLQVHLYTKHSESMNNL